MMERLIIGGFSGLLVAALWCGPALAWSHAGRYGTASGGDGSWSGSGYRGGSASGGGGSSSFHGAYGGSASHTAGRGPPRPTRTATPRPIYGGRATRTYGQGTTATNAVRRHCLLTPRVGATTVTNPYGGSATHYYGYGTTRDHVVRDDGLR